MFSICSNTYLNDSDSRLRTPYYRLLFSPYLANPTPEHLLLQLTKISLIQFKNYHQYNFSFSERIVGIFGPNGIGKTNLLDAIYYLCFTKSYFSRTDVQNAFAGTQGFRIEGIFTKEGTTNKVVCILRKSGKKEMQLNDETSGKLSLHIGRLPCVMIAPDDVAIITEGSENRRRFLDALLSQLDNEYLQQLIDYNRVLTQRNSFLKSIAESRLHDKNLLDVYDEQLIRYGTFIFERRRDFLSTFIPQVMIAYRSIANESEKVNITYESQLITSTFQNILQQFREKDFLFQRTGGGIHKDDLALRLNGQPFKNIASQGQRKSLLFALKLAEYDSLKNSKGFPPLLLLDDVFEKLDESRMHNLLEWVCVKNDGQIFITDTHRERIQQHFDRLGMKFQLVEISPDSML